LAPLANVFARLERNAILQALSVDADAEIARQRSLTSAVISSLADKFARRKEQKIAELRQVTDVARELRLHARQSPEQSVNEIVIIVYDVAHTASFLYGGLSDHCNRHWY